MIRLYKKRTIAVALLALSPLGRGAAIMVYAQPPAPPVATTPSVVFDGVTVIDVVHGRLVPDQRVVIVGTRIRAVGAPGTVQLPAGAQVVDARGKYLMPGLWDMHVHPSTYQWSETARNYTMFLVNGVTGIRDANATLSLDTLRQWRREIQAGTRVGPPRQILSGVKFDNETFGFSKTNESGAAAPTCAAMAQAHGFNRFCVLDTADARHMVDARVDARVDMLKMRVVTRAEYFAGAAEARRRRLPFGGHAHAVTPIEAADSGASIVDHLHALDSVDITFPHRHTHCWGPDATVAQCQPVAEHFMRHGTWLVPTLMVYYTSGSPETERLFKRQAAHLDTLVSTGGAPAPGNWLRDAANAGAAPVVYTDPAGNMRIMHQVGLPILAGTDVREFGFSLHTELAMYVAEGLTPLEALQTATLNPAKLLRATDSLGTVGPGKLADLVLLDANPLADITNTTTIRGVVANGRYFDRATLDRLLETVYAGHKP